LPVSIPEDRAVASTNPVDNAEAVDRPFHKVTNQNHAWHGNMLASSYKHSICLAAGYSICTHDQQAHV
jgi:hypothetical protein